MQMHFETAVGEEASEGDAVLHVDGLMRVCQRLVDSPKETLEKKWAQELLDQHDRGEALEDEEEVFSYYDYLNVMLGRKRFKVSIWMYDISNGKAKALSRVLLGHYFEGIWHTGVVVEWPGNVSEIWYGGRVFAS